MFLICHSSWSPSDKPSSHSSCLIDRYSVQHPLPCCVMATYSKSQIALCNLPVKYSSINLQYWSFLHCHFWERGNATFDMKCLFPLFFSCFIFPKQIIPCGFNIPIMQITPLSPSNTNEDTFMLINESFQVLFTNGSPSLGVWAIKGIFLLHIPWSFD